MELKRLPFASALNFISLLVAITLFSSCHKKGNLPPDSTKRVNVSSFAPAGGVMGTTVIITGDGFSAVTAENHVTINGKQAVVTAATSTNLEVKVPQGAGIGKIRVSVGSQTAVSADEFAYTYNVTTLAGSGLGFKDGADTIAQFRSAYGVATDAAGNIYVADSDNNRVRKITPDGVVSTLAGDGAIGSANGTGQVARFNYPHGLVVDAYGNIFVADAGNNLIRKITAAGEVTTFAGSGTAGYADGAAKDAKFDFPADIAIDPAGNLYVSDGNNHRIRKVSPGGEVSSLGNAVFGFPEGIAIDAAGNLYVTDTGGNQVRKVTPAGVITVFAGTGVLGHNDGPGASAEFGNPEGIAIDAQGNLYVGDLASNRVRRVTPAAVVTTIAGSIKGVVNGPGPIAKFSGPSGIAVDASGNIYVADSGNSRIRKLQ